MFSIGAEHWGLPPLGSPVSTPLAITTIHTLNLQQGATSGSDSTHGRTRIFGHYRQLQAPAHSNIDNDETLRQEISRESSYADAGPPSIIKEPNLWDEVSKRWHT